MHIKKQLSIILLASLSLLLTSCEGDTPKVEEQITPAFDIWVPMQNKVEGMGEDPHIIVQAEQINDGALDITGKGAETGATALTPNVVFKDGYYYNVSREGNFGKFQVKGNQVITIKEIPLPNIADRRFSHSWIDDKTLVVVSSAGKKQEVHWAKIDVQQVKVIAEGKLALEAPKKDEEFNSSGILGYRKADNTLLYSFVYMPKSDRKTKKLLTDRRQEIYMAFIDATTMEVKSVFTDRRAEFLASTSFGETRQQKAFFDKNGDYYFAAAKILSDESSSIKVFSTTMQRGLVFRVKAGSSEIDQSYSGYPKERGKIIAMSELRDGEALICMQDPTFATPDNPVWDSKTNPYVYYYIVLNLKNGEFRHLTEIPFSNGNFAQLFSVVGKVAYIGVNSKDNVSQLYQYDIATGKITKGATLQEGFEFDRIVGYPKTK